MAAQWLTWPSVFHIFGSIGVLWFFLWEWQAASSPAEDSRCSAEEKELLASTTSTSRVRSRCASLPHLCRCCVPQVLQYRGLQRADLLESLVLAGVPGQLSQEFLHFEGYPYLEVTLSHRCNLESMVLKCCGSAACSLVESQYRGSCCCPRHQCGRSSCPISATTGAPLFCSRGCPCTIIRYSSCTLTHTPNRSMRSASCLYPLPVR